MSPQIRLYARPNAILSGSGDYALQITKRLLQFYEDYFKVKYSLPKLGKSRGESLDVFVTPRVPQFTRLPLLCSPWFVCCGKTSLDSHRLWLHSKPAFYLCFNSAYMPVVSLTEARNLELPL